MSTVSGVFPNAITPTFAQSSDPANQARLRRDSETVAFKPIDETEGLVESRRTGIEQPGRLEAEQATEAASGSRSTPELSNEPEASEVQAAEAPRRDPTNEARAEIQQEQADRQAAREEAKLQDDIELIRELAARDREVRAHEQAHQSVGGQYAGPMEFTYQRGPDGKRYAVGGEVSIDISKVPNDPQATLAKADQVRRAALAPAEPSSQDRQVAALATQISIEAQNEIRQLERQEAAQAAEERAEQRELSDEDSQKVEASSESNGEKDELVAKENEERLNEIFSKTSEAVETALDAAYRQQPQQEIGFNLDTTV